MNSSGKKIPMVQLLVCAAMVVTLSMGVRHGFGLWLQPIVQAHDWTRQNFSFALAVQNLTWGVVGIFVGIVADRWGAFRILISGSVLYALGLVGMALSTSVWWFTLTAGVLLGIALAATTYSVIYGILGRQIDPHKRSWAMGVTAAAGSFGQFLMMPLESWLILNLDWQTALLILSGALLLILPLSLGLRESGGSLSSTTPSATPATGTPQGVLQALRQALTYPSFQLLVAGYFVCGFQVVFMGVHMPSYLKDKGLSTQVGSTALALIGFFNIIGTYTAGWLGQTHRKSLILAGIYFARAVAISVFILTPITPMSVYLFSAVIGTLWLSTVPPTSAAIAQIFGIRYMSMLGGVAFCSHQIGSFLGVWLGGYLYDRTGSYDVVWYMTIALALMATALNLAVKEHPITNPLNPAAAAR